jgi:hypothetical protein
MIFIERTISDGAGAASEALKIGLNIAINFLLISIIPLAISMPSGLGVYASHSALDVFDQNALGHALGCGIPLFLVSFGIIYGLLKLALCVPYGKRDGDSPLTSTTWVK